MGSGGRPYELIGWLLFAIGVGFFLALGLRDGDVLATGGSLLFLAGIVAFLVPLLKQR